MEITIYSTETCGYCKMLKSYLHSKNIEFTDKRADLDPAVTKELLDLSGQLGVPFTVITKADGTVEGIVGFDRAKVDSALGLA